MHRVLSILVALAALGCLVWLLIPSSASDESLEGELIDPSDSRQIGMLIGMVGGDIADAAVVRFALQRFEEIHGRKATTRDVGILIGLMRNRDQNG